MKFSSGFLVALSCLASVEAFCPLLSRRSTATLCFMAEEPPSFFMSEQSNPIVSNDFGSALSAYDRFGASPEKIALGININEVLQWLGT